MGFTDGTITSLRSQWRNPGDVATLLMIIGGDVVQKALAQGTGTTFTPVCFSFGWVSYAFMTLVGILGDGRLLPAPDYPVKVFNLRSGYCRTNMNWIVGRLLRDVETSVNAQIETDDHGIRISVFRAIKKSVGPTQCRYSMIHVFGAVCIVAQICLALIPIFLGGEWDVMLIMVAGTLLVQMTGALPQWRAEKLPNRQNSKNVYALTQGNGCRDIVVILGNGEGLDLEEMAAPSNPRSNRPWQKFATQKPLPEVEKKPGLGRQTSWIGNGPGALSRGFLLTFFVCMVNTMLSLLLLINVAADRDYNWVILGIGTLGMFQNAIVAAMSRNPEHRNLPLKWVETITTKKTMDGIMDFEMTYRGELGDWLGLPLRDEFFPGKLRVDERKWWAGDFEAYNLRRVEQPWRGNPRSATSKLEPDSSPSPQSSD